MGIFITTPTDPQAAPVRGNSFTIGVNSTGQLYIKGDDFINIFTSLPAIPDNIGPIEQVTYLKGITSTTELAAIDTANQIVPRLYATVFNGSLVIWQLKAGSDEPSDNIVRPHDYNESLPKVYERMIDLTPYLTKVEAAGIYATLGDVEAAQTLAEKAEDDAASAGTTANQALNKATNALNGLDGKADLINGYILTQDGIKSSDPDFENVYIKWLIAELQLFSGQVRVSLDSNSNEVIIEGATTLDLKDATIEGLAEGTQPDSAVNKSQLDVVESKANNALDGLDGKADKATTYTKSEVDAKVASVYRYKGTVPSYADLPTGNLVVGDVYNVEDSGANYAWTGTLWDKLSETIDLTPYLTKVEASGTYATNDEMQAFGETLLAAANDYTSAGLAGKVDADENGNLPADRLPDEIVSKIVSGTESQRREYPFKFMELGVISGDAEKENNGNVYHGAKPTGDDPGGKLLFNGHFARQAVLGRSMISAGPNLPQNLGRTGYALSSTYSRQAFLEKQPLTVLIDWIEFPNERLSAQEHTILGFFAPSGVAGFPEGSASIGFNHFAGNRAWGLSHQIDSNNRRRYVCDLAAFLGFKGNFLLEWPLDKLIGIYLNGSEVSYSTITEHGTPPPYDAPKIIEGILFNRRYHSSNPSAYGTNSGPVTLPKIIVGAFSSAEKDLYARTNQIPSWARFKCGLENQSSGTLELGAKYQVMSIDGDADFTTVGASDNTPGAVFVATGRSPVWGGGALFKWGMSTNPSDPVNGCRMLNDEGAAQRTLELSAWEDSFPILGPKGRGRFFKRFSWSANSSAQNFRYTATNDRNDGPQCFTSDYVITGIYAKASADTVGQGIRIADSTGKNYVDYTELSAGVLTKLPLTAQSGFDGTMIAYPSDGAAWTGDLELTVEYTTL